MTTFKITVEDTQAEELRKVLHDIAFIKSVEEEQPGMVGEPESAYQKIKNIQAEIGDQELFKDIKDPSEWQREIRKEWDRDF